MVCFLYENTTFICFTESLDETAVLEMDETLVGEVNEHQQMRGMRHRK